MTACFDVEDPRGGAGACFSKSHSGSFFNSPSRERRQLGPQGYLFCPQMMVKFFFKVMKRKSSTDIAVSSVMESQVYKPAMSTLMQTDTTE